MNARAWRYFDWALATAGAAALIVDALLRGGGSLPLVAYPLAVVAAVPLAFLRKAPLASLLGVEAGVIACVAVFKPVEAAVALVAVALFTVALVGDRQRSLLVGGVTAVALVATTLVVDGKIELANAVTRLLVVFVALAIGDTIRSRRALRVATLRAAEQEEREREEESRRRVANERLRIARDLHDSLAHALVAINVRAGVAAHLTDSQDPTAALLDIKAVSADALRDLRATLGLLREQGEAAPVSPARDLAALPELINRARASGLDADMEVEVNGEVVPSPVGRAAFRIVQEALTNVVRHAHAASAHVVVATGNGALRVEVTDDGRGGTGGTEGHGLRGMAERAAALGGRVDTGPRSEGGWRVEAVLPLSRRRDA
ncbi:MAG TPA: histidine kinase [Solirubrobacteraceae bacterium]|nr:histidine kinase [Solirubrobacteraceae bacterium]